MDREITQNRGETVKQIIRIRQLSSLLAFKFTLAACIAAMILTVPMARKAGAGEFLDWIKNSDGEHYQQTEYMPVDPKGDAYLMRKLDQVPMKLVKSLVKKDYREEDLEKDEQERENYDIGKKHPMDVDRLLNSYREVIQDHSEITLTPGQEHDWCPEAKKYLYYGFWHRLGRFITGKQPDFPAPLLLRSKLFLLLACGYTSRYSITGKEEAMEEAIMSYPDRGLMMHDAFRESYRLNNGDMYLTVLTNENVLAKNPYAENRAEQPMQKKLMYLRNDSRQVGDNYGAWYHFAGLVLYGLVRPGLATRAVAEIESLGSIFLEGFDTQEDYINRLGAIFGKKLNKMVKSKSYMIPLSADDRTDYMINDEFAATGAFKGKALITEVFPGSNLYPPFIELLCIDDGNFGAGADLGGLKLTWGQGLNAGKSVTIPAGTTVASGSYMIVSKDPSVFEKKSASLPEPVRVVGDLGEFPAGSFCLAITDNGVVVDAVAAGHSENGPGLEELLALAVSRGWVSSSPSSSVSYPSPREGRSISRPFEAYDTDSPFDWSARSSITPGAPADFTHRRRNGKLHEKAMERQELADAASVATYAQYGRDVRDDRQFVIQFQKNAEDDETVDLSGDLSRLAAGIPAYKASVEKSREARRNILIAATLKAEVREVKLRQEFYSTSFFNFHKKAKLLGQITAAKRHAGILKRFSIRSDSVDPVKFARELDYGKLAGTPEGAALADNSLIDGVPGGIAINPVTGKTVTGTGADGSKGLADIMKGIDGYIANYNKTPGENGRSGSGAAIRPEGVTIEAGQAGKTAIIKALKDELISLEAMYRELITSGDFALAAKIIPRMIDLRTELAGFTAHE